MYNHLLLQNSKMIKYLILFIIIIFNDCSTNPATGEKQLDLVSRDQEISMGRQSDQQIVETMGVYQDNILENYVKELGQRVASKSEKPYCKRYFE